MLGTMSLRRGLPRGRSDLRSVSIQRPTDGTAPDAHLWDPMSDRNRLLRDALSSREEAQGLIRQITDAKATAETGRPDLYRRVTGSSSLDAALSTAKRTLDQYNRVLSKLEQMEPDPPEVVVRAVTPSGIPSALDLPISAR